MTMIAIFWLSVGVLAGVAVSFALVSFWRKLAPDAARESRKRALIIAAGGGLAMVVCAISLYVWLGRPDLVDPLLTTQSNPHGSSMGVATDAEALPGGSGMEDVTKRLATRLAQEGGSDSDWDLLAQSYEMLGMTLEAEHARSHQLVDASPKGTVADSELLAKAEVMRRQRDYVAARQLFEQAIKAKAMTADAWANYADVLASQPNGQLADASAAIDKALALQPQHPKALWLKASLAHQQKRYADALVLWRQLRQVTAESPADVAIVDANIAEAEQLLATSSTSSKATPKAALKTESAAVKGEIDIDTGLLARVSKSAVLFVFARSDAGGPPLAVWRTHVDRWPVAFRLDDSLAMTPARVLSQFEHVVVQARISQTGNALPSRGDLQTASQTVGVRSGTTLHLRIDQELRQ